MADNGNWTQLLTLGAVVLGGVITLATTWLANLQQNADRARERREGRLVPLYLSLHLAVRDWVTQLEDHTLAGFPQDEFSSREAGMKEAREALHRITYQIDLMSSPKIAFETELLEDSLLRLTESLGFRLRLRSIPPVLDARNKGYVKSELKSISERRIRLLERMQDDLSLKWESRRAPRSIGSKSFSGISRRTQDHGQLRRDEDGFLIDDEI